MAVYINGVEAVSSIIQAALDLKANLASPTFTGTVSATQIAFGTAPFAGIIGNHDNSFIFLKNLNGTWDKGFVVAEVRIRPPGADGATGDGYLDSDERDSCNLVFRAQAAAGTLAEIARMRGSTGVDNPAFELSAGKLTGTLNADNQTIDNLVAKLGTSHGTTNGRLAHGIARGTYDFSVSGGGGAIGLGATIPNKAIVVKAWFTVLTALTSLNSTATIKLDIPIDDDSGLLAALVITSSGTLGHHACIQDGAVANFSEKCTAARELTMSVGVEALTAGKFNLWAEYIVTD